MTQAKQKDLLGREDAQETAPVPHTPTPPAIPQEDIGLAGKFDESDWTIPAWFLVQPSSQEFPTAKEGQFATKDGRVADSLIVVPLRIAATRAMWPREMGEGRSPECASNDRIGGRPFGDFTPYDSGIPDEYRCEECPQYGDEPWSMEHGCFKGYAILVALQTDDDEPAIIRVKGTSVAPIKQKLLAHFQPRPGRVPKPVWTMSFEITSEKAETAKGKYYVLSPRLLGPVEDPNHYRDLARHLAGVSVEAVEEDIPVDESEEPMD